MINDSYSTEIIESASPNSKPILKLKWACVLSNNGNRPISVISCMIVEKTAKGFNWYQNIYNGIFHEENENIVNFPLNIESGNSLRIIFYIGIQLNVKTYELIKKSISQYNSLTVKQLHDFLIMNKTDFYGNSIEVSKSSHKRSHDAYEQKFVASFSTSKGRRFSFITSVFNGDLGFIFDEEFLKEIKKL